jgi:hypothetical protein
LWGSPKGCSSSGEEGAEGGAQESEQPGPAAGDTLVILQGVLILLRGMLAEADTHMATIDDLKSTPTSIRISLALTSQNPPSPTASTQLHTSQCLSKMITMHGA